MVVIVDHDRAAVYAAEDQWTTVLDRGGSVDFFGSTLVIPVQRRFGDIAAVRIYVDDVCRGVGIPAPSVRARKGHTRAHYESASATIAIPGMDGSLAGAWAAREAVVLHEIAHHWAHCSRASVLHDQHFRQAMIGVVRYAIGHEAALLLQTGYDGVVRG